DTECEALVEALKVNETLIQLILRSNEISDIGSEALAEALKVNEALTQLILQSNEISEIRGQSLAEALKVNKALIQLNLGHNRISDTECEALVEALKVNETLIQLILRKRANCVLSVALRKWLDRNHSTHWSDGLLPVVYGINTRVSSTTKTTPYETMFGQQPRSNSDFWKIVKENRIEDEDQLPAPVESENMLEPSIIIETQSDDFDNDIREHNLNVSNLISAMFPLLDINDSANASHVLSGSLLDLSSSFCVNYHQPQSTTTNSTTPDLVAFDSPSLPSRTLTTFPQSSGLASNVLSLNGNTSTILQVSIPASHSQSSPSTLTASYLATSSSLPPRHAD
ncbi:unnamed protein product, partial [Didymodactylos carnosus]